MKTHIINCTPWGLNVSATADVPKLSSTYLPPFDGVWRPDPGTGEDKPSAPFHPFEEPDKGADGHYKWGEISIGNAYDTVRITYHWGGVSVSHNDPDKHTWRPSTLLLTLATMSDGAHHVYVWPREQIGLAFKNLSDDLPVTYDGADGEATLDIQEFKGKYLQPPKKGAGRVVNRDNELELWFHGVGKRTLNFKRGDQAIQVVVGTAYSEHTAADGKKYQDTKSYDSAGVASDEWCIGVAAFVDRHPAKFTVGPRSSNPKFHVVAMQSVWHLDGKEDSRNSHGVKDLTVLLDAITPETITRTLPTAPAAPRNTTTINVPSYFGKTGVFFNYATYLNNANARLHNGDDAAMKLWVDDLEKCYLRCKPLGIRIVRIWIHSILDGYGDKTDSGYVCPVVDRSRLADRFEMILKKTREHEMMGIFVMVDFPAWGQHHKLPIIVNERERFIADMIAPLAERAAQYKDAVYAFEAHNEPLWSTVTFGPGEYNVGKGAGLVPSDVMRDYLNKANSVANKWGLNSTVGHVSAYDTQSGITTLGTASSWVASVGRPLPAGNIVQFHYYPKPLYMPVPGIGKIPLNPEHLGITPLYLPQNHNGSNTIIGEISTDLAIPSSTSSIFAAWPDLNGSDFADQPQMICDRIALCHRHGYELVGLWPDEAGGVNPGDKKLSDGVAAGIKLWNDRQFPSGAPPIPMRSPGIW